jgi:sugar O-acyltransferase (sialic acid O-acetyltransferase NeuD family)
MDIPKSVVILGAGGMAHIVYWQLRETTGVEEFVFIEDESDRKLLDLQDGDRPIVKDWNLAAARTAARTPDPFRYFTLAVSDPIYKKRFIEKAIAHGLKPAPTFIHPMASINGPRNIGRGGLIAGNTSVMPVTEIGDYVTMAPMASVGHHCTVGRYTFLAAGAVVLGNVHMGEGVWIGGGACVRERLHIAPWSVVGAQGLLTREVTEAGTVLAGVPARPLPEQSERYRQTVGLDSTKAAAR